MKETISNLKKVYKYGKDYKKNLIIFTGLSLIFIIVNVIYPIYTAKQVTTLTSGLFHDLIKVTILLFGFDVLLAIRMFIIRKNTQVFFRGTFKNLQLAVSKEILRIKVKDIDKTSSGLFIERLNGDCTELSHIFTVGMGQLTGLLTNIGIFVAVFLVNKWAFLFYFMCSIVISILYAVRVREVNEKDKMLRRQREQNTGLTGELVRGVRDIKMLNARNSFIKEIEKSIDSVTRKNFDMRNTEMKYNLLIEIIRSFLSATLIFLLIYLISIDNISIPTAIVLYSYQGRIFFNLVADFGDLLQTAKTFNLSSKRVFSMFEETEFDKEKFGSKHINKVKGDFEFKNVSFGYDKDKLVLNGMSFKVNANETVAFVGKSGEGKTTIFNLLCKMYDINSGEITIDGININDLDEYSIRNNITIISQNPYIFNLSIGDNLKLVKSDLTEKEMVNACKMACLDDFIESLPEKYDTIVGEGGVKLSGGQRQRLAIARAFIQKTEIILFDEATSALDNETQEKISEAINNLKKRYTILIIAHRFSTIINSDRIYFIEDGKVLDSGSHNKLLKSCRQYKNLYESEIKKDE